jgi:hypothetical protein
MKAITNCLSAAILASLLGVITMPVSITPSEAQIQIDLAKKYRGAPGPIVGTGLPVLVIAGGAFWVVTRLRRKR